jgi:sialate O-acetylesterase
MIILRTLSAGGPYTKTDSGYNTIVFENVMVGEVWLCSGQSNMEWSARSGIINAEEEINNSGNPMIRLLTVSHSTSVYPQDRMEGSWQVCSPATMQNFSAIGYFFARKLQKELGIAVGIINSSWGGTPAEAWTPEPAVTSNLYLREAAKLLKPVPWGPVEPGRIYNTMINPLIQYRIAGVLWYQGEANTANYYAYTRILANLIESWRSKWGYEFPFYFAQIAPFRYGRPYEGAEVREAQRRTLTAVSKTAMVVVSDIGDTLDIHPKNKQDVGLRFANIALKREYGKKITEDSGPQYRDYKAEKEKLTVYFDNAAGLMLKGGSPTEFEIAGADLRFYKANAKIKDNSVILTSDKVKVPLHARFGWRNTSVPNLFNNAGLPASCFTTLK